METYLALDLGGTKLMIGEVDASGNILRHKKYASGYFNQLAALDIIKTSLNDYIATVGWHTDEKPRAMGIGLIGRVDTENGVWLQIDPTRTHPLELCREMEETFGIPCFIDNDVKSATRAEMVWGFGRLTRNFLYLNVGTGIAVGTVIDGVQLRGSHFNAGEVGHVRTGVQVGIKCGCGRIDCVEAIASGIGFDNCARHFSAQYPESPLNIPPLGQRVSVEEVYAHAQNGDPLCQLLVDNAALALANLIMNLVRVTDPDTIVLGGGVVADGYMLSCIQQHLHPITMRFVTNGVVITKLHPVFVGLMGAAAVAIEHVKATEGQN